MKKIKEGLSSRIVAFQIINSIIYDKQSLDEAILQNKKYPCLSKEDRAFVRLIVMATLRNIMTIDDIIQKFSNRPLNKLNPKKILNILRLGVAQILFIDDIPAYAVVNLVVEIANLDIKTKHTKAIINAILRNIIRANVKVNKEDMYKNIPNWLFQNWVQDYGYDKAKKIAEASLQRPYLDITVKKHEQIEQVASKIGGKVLFGNTIRCNDFKGDITKLAGFAEGDWWVQDIASSLPVQILSGKEDLKNKIILDLCAAPGGKTMQLAALGAKVTAVDKSCRRLEILKANLKRVGLAQRVDIIQADVSKWQSKNKFDYILLDAPCSATGTIRRHPDLLYIKSAKDIDKIVKIQEDIIKNASKMLNKDGLLVYSVCSLQKLEGEQHFKKKSILKNTSLKVDKIEDFIIKPSNDGFVRSLPYMFGGMDGFFIARLRHSC